MPNDDAPETWTRDDMGRKTHELWTLASKDLINGSTIAYDDMTEKDREGLQRVGAGLYDAGYTAAWREILAKAGLLHAAPELPSEAENLQRVADAAKVRTEAYGVDLSLIPERLHDEARKVWAGTHDAFGNRIVDSPYMVRCPQCLKLLTGPADELADGYPPVKLGHKPDCPLFPLESQP